MTRKARVRQHANPLSNHPPAVIPNWDAVFPPGDRPLDVDIGSAHGEFLLEHAARSPERNVVGLEIRRPMVTMVAGRIGERGLANAHVLFCNANRDFMELFGRANVDVAFVHFPDPWFKKRHHKRRLLTEAFVDTLSLCLKPGGEIRFMTDFADYAQEAAKLVEAHDAFRNPHGPGNPAPVVEGRPLSHREDWHQAKGDPVYRFTWRRT
ncbi:tRNA (guanosine(46)-N7)-methyltransferase TrmB [Planctomycetota bacterium]|nr:tRNA (guanosine(46)-N7)-methyltransferase TrmB [Planctomycetota bacterium]